MDCIPGAAADSICAEAARGAYTGYAMTYAGSQMMAAGAALLVLGAPLIARGAAMVAAGGAMVRTSTQMLVKSQMQLNFAQITALSMQKLALDSAGDTNIRKTMKAQEEYEKAEASLDYFTKIGDVETLKHRLIAFGSLRKDDDSTKALYTLTEEDLKYLVENGTSVDSTGASVTLTAQESSDALDGRNLQNDSEFRDSFGRRYSLTKPEITSPPGALSGGLYRAQDGTQYVRVRRVNDAGAEYFAYAKLESGTGTQKTYDAGRVLDALTTQGDQLRAERKAAYIAAEDAAGSQSGDGTFASRERDATYDMLFQAATGDAAGGREYSGYRITYADVAENADLVYRDQLNQRLNVQLQDWDIRAQQLNDQKADWEDRVGTIISRGKDSWNLAENRFAAEQRKWEADQKRSEEEGKKHWEEKTKEILAKKLAFEEEMAVKKAQADANTNLSSIIDTLNAEISQFSQNTGIKKDSINKAEVLARIVDEIKSSVPTGANKLAELNSEVSKFNTRLEITELANSGNTQFDSKLASALANYDAELSDHAKNMRVLANVKVYQEYLALRNNIRQQIMDQNDSIDLQTQSAAAAAGFARSGASYIKRSAGGSVARIDAYVKMDADKAIRNAFGATGYEEMSDQSVTSLLKNANETEVEAFFYTQKLRLQAASEQIFGNGASEARRGSRDAKIIGSLGKWIGAAPDSAAGGLANRAAGDSYADDAKTRNIFTQYVATGGFGELGEYGSRPSGIAFGFYVQLQYLGEQLNQQDATVINNAVKHANSTTNAAAVSGGMALLGGLTSAGMQTAVTRAATTGDTSWIAPQLMHTGQMGAGFAALGALSEAAGSTPIGTFMNQYNPALMFANSSYNVRIGSQVNHINEGYLWEANALAMIKAPLATLGGMMLAAGIASSGTIIGAILIPIGAAIAAAANSIQVNTTTGERAMKATDQAAISTGLTLVSSVNPGAGALAGFGVNSGVQYDSEGMAHGWKAEGTRVGNAALTSVMGSIGGAAGADIANTMLTVSEQYYRQKHGQTNTYDQLAAGPDLGRLGELIAIGMPAVMEAIAAKQANQRDQTNRAAGNLQALGAIGRRLEDFIGGAVDGVLGAIGSAARNVAEFFGGIGHAIVSSAQVLKNGILYGSFLSNQALEEQIFTKVLNQGAGQRLLEGDFQGFGREFLESYERLSDAERSFIASNQDLSKVDPQSLVSYLNPPQGRMDANGNPVIEGPGEHTPHVPKVPPEVERAIERVKTGQYVDGDDATIARFWKRIVEEMQARQGGIRPQLNYYTQVSPKVQEEVTRQYFGAPALLPFPKSWQAYRARINGGLRTWYKDQIALADSLGLDTSGSRAVRNSYKVMNQNISESLKTRSDFEIVSYFGFEDEGADYTRFAQIAGAVEAGVRILNPRNWKTFGTGIGKLFKREAAAETRLSKKAATEVLDKMTKGEIGEAAARKALEKAGYKHMESKVEGNHGFDGVFAKFDEKTGEVVDIIIAESKFSSSGRAALSETSMGIQMSDSWIKGNIAKMLRSSDESVRKTGQFLKANEEFIRKKISVFDGRTNRWNVLEAPD